MNGKRQRSEDHSPTSGKNRDSNLESSFSPRKRRKSDQTAVVEALLEIEKSDTHAPVGLLALPVELLQSIHLYAKNPSFPITNKYLLSTFSDSPVSVKARYLLARWHEAYYYGFQQTSKHEFSRSINSTEVPHRPPLPTSPSSDLLANGFIPELNWSSRFIPVLPTNDFPYPMENAFHRSADHYILDYCLRYRICNVTVLHAVEDIVLSRSEFANISMATGLWRDEQGYLHTHEPQCIKDSEKDSTGIRNAVPTHLRVTEIPKRLFQSLKVEQITDNQPAPYHTFWDYAQNFDPDLMKHLASYIGPDGNGPFPSHEALFLLLSIAALHTITNHSLPISSAPFNSFEGLPLAKATFAKSTFMVQFLLCLGAEPSRKGNLALYIAIRNGWLDGLIQMVERDETKYIEWHAALHGIREWFWKRECEQRGLKWTTSIFYNQNPDERLATKTNDLQSQSVSPLPVRIDHLNDEQSHPPSTSSPSNGEQQTSSTSDQRSFKVHTTRTNSFKRRRLLDRANLDSKMLKEAVKHNNWSIANWIRSKGIAPDLRTIKIIEMKQSSGQIGRDLT